VLKACGEEWPCTLRQLMGSIDYMNENNLNPFLIASAVVTRARGSVTTVTTVTTVTIASSCVSHVIHDTLP
jgi:hypothetical protein